MLVSIVDKLKGVKNGRKTLTRKNKNARKRKRANKGLRVEMRERKDVSMVRKGEGHQQSLVVTEWLTGS